jgi:hypothetical protein
LARLLGDVLDSPVGALRSEFDDKAIATEGQERKGKYRIRQGHAVPVAGIDSLLPNLNQFGYEHVTDEKVVIMWRDPRDILVSAAHHWDRSLDEMLDCMIYGKWPLPHGGGWVKWIQQWINADCDFCTTYEKLSSNTASVLTWIRLILREQIDKEKKVEAAVQRQSFAARREWTEKHGDKLNYGKEFQLRFLRKGVVGDWKNHLMPKHLALISKHFGEMMKGLGYE